MGDYPDTTLKGGENREESEAEKNNKLKFDNAKAIKEKRDEK